MQAGCQRVRVFISVCVRRATHMALCFSGQLRFAVPSCERKIADVVASMLLYILCFPFFRSSFMVHAGLDWPDQFTCSIYRESLQFYQR